ncbi:MAG: L-rhamnose mutarotase [Ginsengibacter sp.]
MKRYCLTLDLKNDPQLIKEYEALHKAVWPEILDFIKADGIENMVIYRYGVRMFMIMEVSDDFSFEKKRLADAGNAKVKEWEEFTWKYQQPLEGAPEGEKWILMNKIFELKDF